MQVDGYRQAIGEHGVHGLVEPRNKIRVEASSSLLKRHGVDAQAHVVEAHLCHQRNVVRVGVGVGVVSGVVVGRLRKPMRYIDAALQVLRAREGDLLVRGTILCKSGKNHRE